MTIRTISILGCGWLGFPLAQQLVEDGYAVKGSTTRAEKHPMLTEAGIEAFQIKLNSDLPVGNEAFFDTDLVVLNVPPGRRRPDVEERHPGEVKSVLEAAKYARVPHLIFVSSTSVYGDSDGIVSEATAPAPVTASGRALLKAENLIKEDFPEIRSTILRMAGLIGPKRNPARFLAGKTDLTKALTPVNLVTLHDALQAILAVIKLGKWQELYNICSDGHPDRKSYYTRKALDLGLTPPDFRDDPDPRGKIVDNTKASRELHLRFSSVI